MNTIEEPAFPRDHRYQGHNGMSLRDWFAGQALAEFVRINERVTTGRENIPYDLVLKVTAEQAYALADAMIAVRKEPHAPTNPN